MGLYKAQAVLMVHVSVARIALHKREAFPDSHLMLSLSETLRCAVAPREARLDKQPMTCSPIRGYENGGSCVVLISSMDSLNVVSRPAEQATSYKKSRREVRDHSPHPVSLTGTLKSTSVTMVIIQGRLQATAHLPVLQRMVRLQCRAVFQCRIGARALATAIGPPCHMSAAGGLQQHRPKCPRSKVRRRTSSVTNTSLSGRALSTSSNAGVSCSGELLRLTASEQGAEPLSRQELRALLSDGRLQAMQPGELVAWIDRWTELDDVLLSSDVKRVTAPELRQALAHALTLLGTQAEGCSLGLCSQLLFALGRVGYVWEAHEIQQLRQMASRLAPLALGEGGKGLKKMSPSELSRLSAGLGHLEMRHVMGLLKAIEKECLRRGLTKFRPRDLADLFLGVALMGHEPNAELLEAFEERVGRRGYLKGRNGDTTPDDAVRLLRVMSMVIKTPNKELLEMAGRMCGDPSFRGELETPQLAGLLYVYSMLDLPDRTAQMEQVLGELEQRTGGLHRADVSQHVVARVLGAIQRAPDLAEGREVVRRMLDHLQGGETGIWSAPRLLSLVVRTAVDLDMQSEYGPLVQRWVHEVQMQGFGTFGQPLHIPRTLRLLRMLGLDPGHATVDDAVRHYIDRGGEGGGEGEQGSGVAVMELRNLGQMMTELRHVQEEHGYHVPGALLEYVFRRCAQVDTQDAAQINCMGWSIKLAGDVCTRHADSPVGHGYTGLQHLVEALLSGERGGALMGQDGHTRGGLLLSLRRLCKDVDSKKAGDKTLVRTLDTMLWDHLLRALEKGEEGDAWLGRLSCMELGLLTEGVTWGHISLVHAHTAQALGKVVAEVLQRPLERYPPELEVVLLDCLLRLKAGGWAGVVGGYKEKVAGVLDSLRMRGLSSCTWSTRRSSLLFVLRALARLKAPIPPGLVPALLEAVGQVGVSSLTLMQLGKLLGYVHSLDTEPLPQWLRDDVLAHLSDASLGVNVDATTAILLLDGLALTRLRPDDAFLSSLVSSLHLHDLERLPLGIVATLLSSLATLDFTPNPEVMEHAMQCLCAFEGEDPYPHAHKLVKSARYRAIDLLPALVHFDAPTPRRLLDTLAAAAMILHVPSPSQPDFVSRVRLVLQAYSGMRHYPFHRPVMTRLVASVAGAMTATKMEGFDAMDVAQCLTLFSKYNVSADRQFVQTLVRAHLDGHDGRVLEPTAASVPLLLKGIVRLPQNYFNHTALVRRQLTTLIHTHGGTCSAQDMWASLRSTYRLTMVVDNAGTMATLWTLCHGRLGYKDLPEPALRCLVRSTLRHNMHPGEQVVGRLGKACREQGMAHVVEDLAITYGAIEGHAAKEESKAQGRMIQDGRKWVQSNHEGKRFLLELLALCRNGEGRHIEPSKEGVSGSDTHQRVIRHRR